METCEGSRKHIKRDNPKIPRKIRGGFAGLLIVEMSAVDDFIGWRVHKAK